MASFYTSLFMCTEVQLEGKEEDEFNIKDIVRYKLVKHEILYECAGFSWYVILLLTLLDDGLLKHKGFTSRFYVDSILVFQM